MAQKFSPVILSTLNPGGDELMKIGYFGTEHTFDLISILKKADLVVTLNGSEEKHP